MYIYPALYLLYSVHVCIAELNKNLTAVFRLNAFYIITYASKGGPLNMLFPVCMNVGNLIFPDNN